MSSEEQLSENVRDLWVAAFGEPPAAEASPTMLLDRLIGGLPLPTYDTIRRNGVVLPLQDR